MARKYVNLSNLSTFLDNLKNIFASISHKHNLDDIADYTVDNALSDTSTNSVQNKVINAEFEAVNNAMNALDLAIDGKANASHTHDDLYYTKAEIDGYELITTSDIDTICGDTIEVATASEVRF